MKFFREIIRFVAFMISLLLLGIALGADWLRGPAILVIVAVIVAAIVIATIIEFIKR